MGVHTAHVMCRPTLRRRRPPTTPALLLRLERRRVPVGRLRPRLGRRPRRARPGTRLGRTGTVSAGLLVRSVWLAFSVDTDTVAVPAPVARPVGPQDVALRVVNDTNPRHPAACDVDCRRSGVDWVVVALPPRSS